MWFRFPQGTTGISVEGQYFQAEVIDEEGFGHFRAPDHFAPAILGQTGFEARGAPPGTDLPDLPQADPERDSAIVRMAAQVQSLERENDALRQQLAEARGQINTLTSAKPVEDSIFNKKDEKPTKEKVAA